MIATTDVMPGTATGTSDELLPLKPSWPAALEPQQTTAPVWRRAHVNLEPAATAVASVSPGTTVGREETANIPFPNWPEPP